MGKNSFNSNRNIRFCVCYILFNKRGFRQYGQFSYSWDYWRLFVVQQKRKRSILISYSFFYIFDNTNIYILNLSFLERKTRLTKERTKLENGKRYWKNKEK